MEITIRTLHPEDVDPLAAAFETWPKPRELFVDYASRVAAGKIDLVVAELDGSLAGYLVIRWWSSYPPFASSGIPEIADFNVLPPARRRGVGGALMDEAERRVGQRSAVVGIGVGLYVDYGSAQRMYVRRGYVPDGAGVVIDGASATPGAMIRLDDSPELMFTKRLFEGSPASTESEPSGAEHPSTDAAG
jgi:GNAT superfamily N-acetyltransferase